MPSARSWRVSARPPHPRVTPANESHGERRLRPRLAPDSRDRAASGREHLEEAHRVYVGATFLRLHCTVEVARRAVGQLRCEGALNLPAAQSPRDDPASSSAVLSAIQPIDSGHRRCAADSEFGHLGAARLTTALLVLPAVCRAHRLRVSLLRARGHLPHPRCIGCAGKRWPLCGVAPAPFRNFPAFPAKGWVGASRTRGSAPPVDEPRCRTTLSNSRPDFLDPENGRCPERASRPNELIRAQS